MNLKNAFTPVVAAAGLAVTAPQEADAVVMKMDVSAIINEVNNPYNVVPGSLIGVGDTFSVSFLFDTAASPIGGAPGSSATYEATDFVFSAGDTFTGTMDRGIVNVRNVSIGDGGRFGLSSVLNPAVTVSGLPEGVSLFGLSGLFDGPGDLWSNTDISNMLDLSGTTERTSILGFINNEGQGASYFGQITDFSVREVTAVPEPGSTGLMFGIGAGVLAIAHMRSRRKEQAVSQEKPQGPSPT